MGIVECGSISAGARRLKIPRPTLSRSLRSLEERCGTALLRRDTHQMSLTQTGQQFLTDAPSVLAHAEAADQRLREDQTTLSGHLRLFATLTSANPSSRAWSAASCGSIGRSARNSASAAIPCT